MYDKKQLHKVRVWDLPTRLFHWALAALVIALVVSGTLGGAAMIWHFRFGYAVFMLLLFRIVWGLVGGRWSRFTAFVYSPTSVIAYLRGQGKPEHGVGHSPVGAGSVFAMLAVLIAQVGSGLMSDDEIAFAGPLTSQVSSAWVSVATNYHKNIGKWLLIGLVALHVLAIVVYLVRRHNLVGAMVHGDKELVVKTPASRDDLASRALALVVLAACGGAVYWVSTLAAPAF